MCVCVCVCVCVCACVRVCVFVSTSLCFYIVFILVSQFPILFCSFLYPNKPGRIFFNIYIFVFFAFFHCFTISWSIRLTFNIWEHYILSIKINSMSILFMLTSCTCFDLIPPLVSGFCNVIYFSNSLCGCIFLFLFSFLVIKELHK